MAKKLGKKAAPQSTVKATTRKGDGSQGRTRGDGAQGRTRGDGAQGRVRGDGSQG